MLVFLCCCSVTLIAFITIMHFKVPAYFSTRMMIMWVFFECSLGIESIPSPCPGVLTYNGEDLEDGRLYSKLMIKIEKRIEVAKLKITLDIPSDLLVSWTGNVTSFDNKIYIITNEDSRILSGGITYKVEMMVKFIPSTPVPWLDKIDFNGQKICPPDIAPSCGIVNAAHPLITGGQQTEHGQWPWHVALYKTEGINLNYICGGTLVSKTKVITAAHCLITPANGKIRTAKSLIACFGKHSLRQYTDDQGVQIKEVLRLNVNPNYNGTNYHGDIAVLTLASDVEYSKYVKPVCIWEPVTDDRMDDIEGKEGVVPGFGLDENGQTNDELRVAKLPVVSAVECLRSYPKFYSEYKSEKSFCAGFRNGTSPCSGDSGGGLVFKRKSAWYLRGIVSLSVASGGFNFCDPNNYVIFTDVAKHHDFLRKNL